MKNLSRLLLATLLVTALLCGCASLDTNTYNAETAAATAALAARHGFVAYYKIATNAPAQFNTTLDNLASQRQKVEALSIQIGVSIDLVDDLRLSYRTNSALQTPLTAALSTLIQNESNLVYTVQSFINHQTQTP